MMPSVFGRRTALALPFTLAPARASRADAPVPDGIGRPVALRGPAERIVLGFNFEEFTAIAGPAGWDRVVGYAKSQWSVNRVTGFARFAAAIPRLTTLPDIGNNEAGNFSAETIISLRPDLVILPEVWLAPLAQQIRQIEALGIPVMVVDYNAQIPERHVASTLAMGAATGATERARELAELYAGRLGDIQRRAAAPGGRRRVYVELGQGGPASIGNSFWKAMWGRMLDLIGAENIAAGRIAGGWGPLSAEYVLAANPEIIVIAGSDWRNRPEAVLTGYGVAPAITRARLAPYASRPGWSGLSAIRAGELHAVEHGLCRALFDYTAMYYIARQIMPDRFADIDPVEELRRFHARYLPVEFDGTWMTRLT